MLNNLSQELKDAFPLTQHLARIGIRLRGEGKERTATRCAAKQHKPDHWCVSIQTEKQIWHCNDCGIGGSIIDWLSVERGMVDTLVIKEMVAELEQRNCKPLKPVQPASGLKTIAATYDYTDENGNLLYQAVRYEPKEFRQRRPSKTGSWIWTMEGINRVLYRLPEVLAASLVAICEGEKDVESLRLIGYVATCNVGGAGKWLDAYSEFLAGKDILILPDNDEPGKKHGDAIIKSLEGKANSIKLVQIPAPYKDVTDFLQSADPAITREQLKALIEKTPHTLKPLPVYSMAEMEDQYIRFVRSVETRTFDLSKFIPSLGRQTRRLMPGELIVVMSDTGVGKTAIQQCLARASYPLPTLFFELELPGELMFERFVQMETDSNAADVESKYRVNGSGSWRGYRNLNHIMVCAESGLTTGQIESFIYRSELKGGAKPAVVFVDYIGLIRGEASRSRYEKLSSTAEEMKVIAKRTSTIVVLGTQVARPEKSKDSLEPKLHDAKDSGSIENSAGLVLGAWRPDHETMMIKVLKNTKGKSGVKVECNFNGETMQITERTSDKHYS